MIFKGKQPLPFEVNDIISNKTLVIQTSSGVLTKQQVEQELTRVVTAYPSLRGKIIVLGQGPGVNSAWNAATNPWVRAIITINGWYDLSNVIAPARVINNINSRELLQEDLPQELRTNLEAILNNQKEPETQQLRTLQTYSPSAQCQNGFPRELPTLIIHNVDNTKYSLKEAVALAECAQSSTFFAPHSETQRCGPRELTQEIKDWAQGIHHSSCLAINEQEGIALKAFVPLNDRAVTFKGEFQKSKELSFLPAYTAETNQFFLAQAQVKLEAIRPYILYSWPAIQRKGENILRPIGYGIQPIRLDGQVYEFPLSAAKLEKDDIVGIVISTRDPTGQFPRSSLVEDIEINGILGFHLGL